MLYTRKNKKVGNMRLYSILPLSFEAIVGYNYAWFKCNFSTGCGFPGALQGVMKLPQIGISSSVMAIQPSNDFCFWRAGNSRITFKTGAGEQTTKLSSPIMRFREILLVKKREKRRKEKKKKSTKIIKRADGHRSAGFDCCFGSRLLVNYSNLDSFLFLGLRN